VGAAAWSSATDEQRLDALERDLRVEADDPSDPAAGGGQGLTLVRFSAQPEPFLTHNTP